MLNRIQQETDQRMQKAIEALKHEMHKIRTGRAHPSILDGIKVVYYGNETPLNQIATISVADARTLAITPWEKSMIPAIEKAIHGAEMGLNPVTSGDTTRVPLPPLTEDRRKELTKMVRATAENSRVSLRNVRRDANNELKEGLKRKEISEDDEHRLQDQIQKLTDKYISEVDKMVHAKEAELMEV
jgi:ribosome recycling factor